MRSVAGFLPCLCAALPSLAQPASLARTAEAGVPAGTPEGMPYEFRCLVVRHRPDPPPYHPLARLVGLQGEVHLRLTIQPSGAVSRVEALEGPALLRETAAAYLRAWSFQPVRVEGRSVPVQCDLQVPFHLEGVSGAPQEPPSKVVVEVEPPRLDGQAVPGSDLLQAELAGLLGQSGLRQVSPAEAGSRDTFHLRFRIQSLHADGLTLCQVHLRGSCWEDRDLVQNEPGKQARIAFLNRVAGQKGEADLSGLIAGALKEGLAELLVPQSSLRDPKVAPKSLEAGAAPEAGRVVDFDFSQIRVRYQPPPPPYPIEAKLARVQGTVVLSLTVDPKGEPVRAVAEEGPVPLLLTAIRYRLAWRFQPALLDGVPQYARFRLTMPFRLR